MFRSCFVVTFLFALASATNINGKFGSAEHTLVSLAGNGILQLSSTTNVSANSYELINARGKSLGTYGKLVSFADYFGVNELSQSVCQAKTTEDQNKVFSTAFNKMWLSDDGDLLNRINDEIKLELDAVAEAKAKGVQPSSTLWSLSTSRYIKILESLAIGITNVDHFNERVCAETTYRVGHALAQQTARAAGSISGVDASTALKMMVEAYATNAYADHFLTDLFSAGHLRTPRTSLISACSFSLLSAAITSMRMHDEDSFNGLFVQNARGDRWLATGDYFLFDLDSSRHLSMVLEAAENSRNEVWQAYLGYVDQFAALSLVPVVDLTDIRNTCPLFTANATAIRTSLSTQARLLNLTGANECAPAAANCESISFSPVRDCFGYAASATAALEMAFFPPRVEYDTCQHAFVSKEPTDSRISSAINLHPILYSTTFILSLLLHKLV